MDFVQQYWPLLLAGMDIVVATIASSHAILNKSDYRAGRAWVAAIWFAPLFGAFLYWMLGVNRIQRKATRLRAEQVDPKSPVQASPDRVELRDSETMCSHLRPLAHLVERVTSRPLLSGNSVVPLINGDEAFPAMIDAIDNAASSVTMCTYIFDNDRAGQAFTKSLSRAVARGVEIRVLVDGVGSRYSWPSGVRLLRKAGINVRTFLPTLAPWRFRYSNLRNHRKVLVIDGKTGFTGGINVRAGNYAEPQSRSTIRDVHFRIEGPVVHQLQSVFALDWSFTTGELLEGELWYSPPATGGHVLARSISDGPDEDLDKLQNVIHGAIGCATKTISIVTPYLLPEGELITALNVAAMRGVAVNILIPETSNLRLVQWASTAMLPLLLAGGCRIWYSPSPFDHTKLMIVDGTWSLIGSANWDPRSLRLNFELNVECYDACLASGLQTLVDQRIANAKGVTVNYLNGKSLGIRIRNGIARLASPYL